MKSSSSIIIKSTISTTNSSVGKDVIGRPAVPRRSITYNPDHGVVTTHVVACIPVKTGISDSLRRKFTVFEAQAHVDDPDMVDAVYQNVEVLQSLHQPRIDRLHMDVAGAPVIESYQWEAPLRDVFDLKLVTRNDANSINATSRGEWSRSYTSTWVPSHSQLDSPRSVRADPTSDVFVFCVHDKDIGDFVLHDAPVLLRITARHRGQPCKTPSNCLQCSNVQRITM